VINNRGLLGYVKRFEGRSNSERREMLLNILKTEGYDYLQEPYKTWGRDGVNVVLAFGRGDKDILATAHYDCAKNSPGLMTMLPPSVSFLI